MPRRLLISFILAFYVPEFVADRPEGELSKVDSYNHIVVLPDIHGDFESLAESLWMAYVDVAAGTLDIVVFAHALRLGAWNVDYVPPEGMLTSYPSDTVVVQMGDVFDRGPHGLLCWKVLDAVPRLLGWRVVRLLGNHEWMNRLGEADSYIHTGDVDEFEQFFKYKEARSIEFVHNGEIWTEIAEKSLLMYRLMDTLFVHGGIDSHWIDQTYAGAAILNGQALVDHLNALSTSRMQTSTVSQWRDLSFPESAIWNRDLANINTEFVCGVHLPGLLARFEVSRIVVGHTPQMDLRMKSLCDARIILADAAMSRWMQMTVYSAEADLMPDPPEGNPCVLIFDNGLVTLEAIYSNERVSLMQNLPVEVFEPMPEIAFETGTQQIAPGVLFAKYTQRGVLQMFPPDSGGLQVVLELKYRGSRFFGLPNIEFPMLTYSGTQTKASLYDLQGRVLREILPLTPIMVTQICLLVHNLHEEGISFGDPGARLIDMFIFDSSQRLLQLADFSFTSVKSTLIEDELGPVLRELKKVRPLNMSRILQELGFTNVNVSEMMYKYLYGADVEADGAHIDETDVDADVEAGGAHIHHPAKRVVSSVLNSLQLDQFDEDDPYEDSVFFEDSIDRSTLTSQAARSPERYEFLFSRENCVEIHKRVSGLPGIPRDLQQSDRPSGCFLSYSLPNPAASTVDTVEDEIWTIIRALHDRGVLVSKLGRPILNKFLSDASGQVWLGDLSEFECLDDSEESRSLLALEGLALAREFELHHARKADAPNPNVCGTIVAIVEMLHSQNELLWDPSVLDTQTDVFGQFVVEEDGARLLSVNGLVHVDESDPEGKLKLANELAHILRILVRDCPHELAHYHL